MPHYASLKLQRTCRINHLLCKPSILNQFSSNKQLKFLFEIVKTSFLGRTIIDVKEWSEKLSTSRDLIRKTIKIFEQLNIITKRTNNEYEFNYYTSMTKDQKGYVKYFSIFENQSFERLPLQSKRVVIYLLSEYFTKTSTKNKDRSLLVDISSWYGDENSERIFPFWHRSEVRNALKQASNFIDMDLSFIDKNQVVIKGILFDENDVAYSNDRAIWLINLLNNYNIFYINEFHIKHLVNFFEHLESNFGLNVATEILEIGLNKLSNPQTEEDEKKREIFLSKLYKCPEFDNNGNVVSDFSEAVIYFRDQFISESMYTLMQSAEKEIRKIESEAESIFNKMPKMIIPNAIQKKVITAYKTVNSNYKHNLSLYNSFVKYIEQHAYKTINLLKKWNLHGENTINDPQDIISKADEYLAITISSMPSFVKHMILNDISMQSVKDELTRTVANFNDKVNQSLKRVGEIDKNTDIDMSKENVFVWADEYLGTISITDEEKMNFYDRIEKAELKSTNKRSIFKYFDKVVETVKQLGSNKNGKKDKKPHINQQFRTDEELSWLEELFKSREENISPVESHTNNEKIWGMSISFFKNEMANKYKKVTDEELDKIAAIISSEDIEPAGSVLDNYPIIERLLVQVRNQTK